MEILEVEDLDIAIDRLDEGKVLACPTDTVYGLITRIDNKEAVANIYKIKDRKGDNPFPILVKDIEMAKEIAKISDKQEEFLDKFWPGKVTAILKSKGVVAKEFELNGTIAVRIPDNEYLKSLLEKPLTGTSANLSGQPSILSSKGILEEFDNRDAKPDTLIDGGELEDSMASTIVDMTGDKIKVLRQGAVTI